MANTYPELDSGSMLNYLVTKYYEEQAPGVFLNLGHLREYIFRTPRDVLIKWAYAAEKFVLQNSGKIILGRLRESIFRLSDVQIAQKILDWAAKFPELDDSIALNKLVKESEIDTEHYTSWIYLKSRDDLVKLALACEKYSQEGLEFPKMGGIHDTVERLSDREVADEVP